VKVKNSKKDKVNIDGDQESLSETEKFIKRLKIQNGIIKKIISPIQDTSTNKNLDK